MKWLTRGFRTMSSFARNENVFQVQKTARLKTILNQTDQLNLEIRCAQKETNGDLRQRIQDKLRSEWTYHSNALEGSQLSLGDTIFFLREGLTVSGKPFKDFVDARNHAEAIDYLYDIVSDKERSIDTILIKQMNALLLKGVETLPAVDSLGKNTKRPIYPGRYKEYPNHVYTLSGEIHKYVEPVDVEPQMLELFDWINEKDEKKIMHPLITAAIGHYNMVRIHPFDDGNGRGARLLMNIILLKNESQLAVIRNDLRQQYIEILNQVDSNGNLEPFVNFIGQALLQTQENILSEIHKNGHSNSP